MYVSMHAIRKPNYDVHQLSKKVKKLKQKRPAANASADLSRANIQT